MHFTLIEVTSNNLGTAFIDDAESTLPHCSCEWKGTVPINSRAAFLLQGIGTTESPCLDMSLACDIYILECLRPYPIMLTAHDPCAENGEPSLNSWLRAAIEVHSNVFV